MINENDLYRVVSAIEEAVNNDSGIDLTYRLNGKSGNETVWVNFQGRKLREEDGRPIIHGVIHNLSQESQLYVDLLNETDRIMFVADAQTREILYANDTAAKIQRSRNRQSHRRILLSLPQRSRNAVQLVRCRSFE